MPDIFDKFYEDEFEDDINFNNIVDPYEDSESNINTDDEVMVDDENTDNNAIDDNTIDDNFNFDEFSDYDTSIFED
jgi:hypothetical protein